MKIAIVFEIFYPTVNGVITSSVNLAENLIDQGHEVVFFAPRWSESKITRVNGTIPVRYFTSWHNWAYPGLRTVLPWNRSLGVALQAEEVDVLHITGPWLLTYAAIRAARKLSIPVVHTFHTMLHEPSYIIYMFKTPLLVPVIQYVAWWYYSLYVRHADVNTGPSLMVCRQLSEHFPSADVRHISNGVEVERFTTHDDRHTLSQVVEAFNAKSFVFVGRLGEEKSVGELIDAMRIAVNRDREIKLFIVGDGPGFARYTAQIARLDLTRHVYLLGRVEHRRLIESGILHFARAFVTASTTENQPMTVIEAICCGTPAIVPDVAGITELVERNGLRFRPHDTESLSEAIVSMAHDDELFSRCREATGEMVSRFDGRNVARQFVEVYREVV